MTQVPMTLTKGQRSKSKFLQKGLNDEQLAISWMLFHPQTSSYLLSQLFVTHFGVVLLLFYFISFFFYFLAKGHSTVKKKDKKHSENTDTSTL